MGSRGKAAVGSSGDDVPQKLTMFCELALFGWTLVKGLRHGFVGTQGRKG